MVDKRTQQSPELGNTEKDPRDWVAWYRLAQVARGAERDAAYDRVRELNPLVEGVPGQ